MYNGNIPTPQEASTSMETQTDFRYQPTYNIAEAARYLRVAPATLHSWNERAWKRPALLSFMNLVEAHLLRALRTEQGVDVDKLLMSAKYIGEKRGINPLWVSNELCKEAGDVLIDTYAGLVKVSATSLIAMRHQFKAHLAGIDWDEKGTPVRLFPAFAGFSIPGAENTVVIDPMLCFGSPVLAPSCVSTAVIAARVDAGETMAELALDYDLHMRDIEAAVLFERVV